MARITNIEIEKAPFETQKQWQKLIAARPKFVPQNLYQVLAHSPNLMTTWSDFAQALRGYDCNGIINNDFILLSKRAETFAESIIDCAPRGPGPNLTYFETSLVAY